MCINKTLLQINKEAELAVHVFPGLPPAPGLLCHGEDRQPSGSDPDSFKSGFGPNCESGFRQCFGSGFRDLLKSESEFGIRIQGLKERSKMLNNNNIILLFSDFYSSFQMTSFDEKMYNYEVILISLKIVLINSQDPDSMNMDPKHKIQKTPESRSGSNLFLNIAWN